MASVGKAAYWGKETQNSDTGATYGKYLRNLSIDQVAGRAIAVMETAGTGALIGAACGATAGGLGAGPGAGIGAGVGFAIGLMATSVWDGSNFLALKAKCNVRGREFMNDYIEKRGGFDEDDVCPITLCIPTIPVTIRGNSRQVFEKSALLEAHKRDGLHPITRQPFSLSDISVSYKHVAQLGKLCDEVLNNDEERRALDPFLVKSLGTLRKETLKRTEVMYFSSYDAMTSDVKSKKMSPREMALEAARLADVIDPLIGPAANENRVHIDVDSIPIPARFLAGNDDLDEAKE